MTSVPILNADHKHEGISTCRREEDKDNNEINDYCPPVVFFLNLLLIF